MAQPSQPGLIFTGIVKQVLSGDNLVIRGQPKGGPPPEKQVALSNVAAPRLARRGTGETKSSDDAPYSWESREYLRKRLVGKEVQFHSEYNPPGARREYGSVFVRNSNGELKNISEDLVAEGLVTVQRLAIRPPSEGTKLIELEDAAKAAKKGLWSDDAKNHVRAVTWNIEDPKLFVDQKKGKPVNAIIEMVRDGSTVRAFLLPTFEHVTVMLTGIKCPSYRRELSKETGKEEMVPEMFAEEAKYFTEIRILQREVQIILEGVSNQNLLGTVLHPAGNIAELLLKEGFAKCVDWSMGVLTNGHKKYRLAERSAKDKKLRLWKDYVATVTSIDEFTGKVTEVINADALMVKLASGDIRKIFLSSLRPPRAQPKDDGVVENGPSRDGKRGRPLYDIPYMFEAREFLRKKLIGKKVNVHIDYVKPANDGYPERQCATVTVGEINIAEMLISKGLATCLRHRADDDLRSSCYDELLSAESRALKNNKGLHNKKDPPAHRIADLSGDAGKSRQYLPFMQRAGRSQAIVEFVASGSRFRFFVPSQSCLFTFLLAGISCPRMKAFNPAGAQISEDELMGKEAYDYSKEHTMQRDVEFQVENIDKGGNFIGFLFVDNVNLSLALVEQGLSKVHFTAERTSYYKELSAAEERAKSKKLGVWKDYVEETHEAVVIEDSERKTNFKKVIVTEIVGGVEFWAQHIDNAAQFEQMQQQLRTEMTDSPPLPGSLKPRRGDLVASLFVDNLWYRAKIEKIEQNGKIHVLYVDYGNREVVSSTKLANLPQPYTSFPPQARLYSLACLKSPKDEENMYDLSNAFAKEALNKEFSLNMEYKFNGQEFVTLSNPETKQDLASTLLSNGVVLLDKRREKRLQKLVHDYVAAQEKARKNRVNLWRYGDFTEDDAPEFGA
ncbi:staphylococcal nuclease domain-containing protein 1-like [Hydractinia symbiolongicarpus]|uniref:staphylococcal nuclease domain-containing protein 1-like n=1 Tax=Hydractinia symbiolongicarpus TaxID=13093 RepID=UPI00254E31D3|nr:staphylococcal nuclease domain-containing protein 1-like [Hydractinia symbiolongicarpus]